MNPIQKRQSFLLLFAAAVSFIFLAEWFLIHSSAFRENPDLFAVGVTFDLVVVIPVLFYLLVLRPYKKSAYLALPSFLISLLLAGWIVPVHHQSYLSALWRAVRFLEVAIVLYLISRIPEFVRNYRAARERSFYITDAFLNTAQSIVKENRIIVVIATEFLLMYFAFAGWFLRRRHTGGHEFTYHLKSGYPAILCVIILLLCIETFAFHLIVSHWSMAAAWVFTALSIYSGLWMLGDFHAIRLNPIIVTADTLYLRIGLRWRANIPVTAIEKISAGAPANSKQKLYLRASVLWPRAVIHLRNPVAVEGLFGMRRAVSAIGVSVDNVDEMVRCFSELAAE